MTEGLRTWHVVATEPELDMHTAPAFRESLLAEINAGHNQLVLDLSAATFVDSSGLAVMVSALKRVRARGGDLRVCSPARAVRSAITMSGLDRVLEIFPDVESATAPGEERPGG
jgi:anti-sigma B factor antagonist